VENCAENVTSGNHGYIFSITIAEAPPPPLHIPAAPYRALF
jgi:hypothetical protein